MGFAAPRGPGTRDRNTIISEKLILLELLLLLLGSGCVNTYKNSIIAEGYRVRLLPPRTPTRDSMIAEGFRVRLLPARTRTRNPLDFEGFRVEEMFQYWRFAHTQSTIECWSFAQTQSTLERGPSPDKINGKMEGPTNQTQTQSACRFSMLEV